MQWTEANVAKIKSAKIRNRIKAELKKGRKAPVGGTESYWQRIVDAESINYRKQPEKYVIGKGQQGVLSVQPYRDEILPVWRFATVEAAKKSSTKIYKKFLTYLKQNDFVGADMAKKFLHMGFTRSRRYANHKNGTKYGEKGILRQAADALTNEKAMAAKEFKKFFDKARTDRKYLKLKESHKNKYTA